MIGEFLHSRRKPFPKGAANKSGDCKTTIIPPVALTILCVFSIITKDYNYKQVSTPLKIQNTFVVKDFKEHRDRINGADLPHWGGRLNLRQKTNARPLIIKKSYEKAITHLAHAAGLHMQQVKKKPG